jgi:hypothetical protein
VDEVKGVPTQTEIEAAAAQYQAHQAQLAAQHQQTEQPPEGIDPELFQALKNPKVQAALQQQLDGAEKARAQYAQAAWQSAQLAAASLVSGTPELAGIPFENYPTAIAMLERTAPMKAAEIKQHISRVQQLYEVAQGARADQARLEQQKQTAQLQSWRAQEAAKFDRWQSRPENAARAKAVGAQAAELFQSEYGVSRQELQALAQTQPLLHSEIGQRLIIDALSYRQALKTATQNPARSVPPVQRPGVAGTYRLSGDADAAAAEFNRNPNPRTAAKMLAAQRRAS